ncbi:MAG: amidohydrolase, partial [Promethearchaeota archaeon]
GNTFFFIEYAVKRLSPSKIIFGSDFPHEHPLVLVKAIELLELSNKDKNLILGENICRLIGS